MREKAKNGSTLVLGLGNVLMGDEGFGVHVAHQLKGVKLPSHVRVEEGGVGGFNLLGYLEGVERLIVVDVMMTDSPPGELKLFKPGAESREPGKIVISFHQIGIMELVKMWSLLGFEPDILFLVTRPEEIGWSTHLSPRLQSAAGRAVELLKELSLDNFTLPERSQGLCTL